MPFPAYIDPGSGSLIIQAAIAAIIAIPIFFRSFFTRLVRPVKHPEDGRTRGDDGAPGA